MLLHVVDASRDPERQISAVDTVLRDIDAAGKPTVLALNKSDLLTEPERDKLRGRFPEAVLCSAARDEGMSELVAKLGAELARLKVEVVLDVPFDKGDVVARVHAEGEVMEESHSAAGTHLVARVNRGALSDLGPYLSSTPE